MYGIPIRIRRMYPFPPPTPQGHGLSVYKRLYYML